MIVGAGPTGLMMACSLARLGIEFRIIDKKSKRTAASNAIWIQTLTIELFDRMGIAKQFIKAGQPCLAINFYIDGKYLSQLPLNEIDSIYPFILMLPQSETERILEEDLNTFHHFVERSLELIEIEHGSDGTISTLKQSDGQLEKIKSDWLIACDGANSFVRQKCDIDFPGEDLTEQCLVADATIKSSYLPKDQTHFFFGPRTTLVAFPLGSEKYRLVANLDLDHPRTIFTEREVIEIVQERAHGNYYITNVKWISLFWIHGRIANLMRKHSIFLVGDAAHVHSPAGGQGMNTGLQDAYNLAWKLALVIQEKAAPSFLDSYQAERYPVVKEIVEQNEYFTKMALFDKNFLSTLQKFGRKLSKNNKHFFKEIGNQLTQLAIQYKNSPIIAYGKQHSPKPGERAPNVIINHISLYQYFKKSLHHILLFTGTNPNKKQLEEFTTLQEQLNNMYSDLINTYIVSNIASAKLTIEDLNGVLHEAYKITKPAMYLIRPDNYIAYYSEDLNLASIVNFLNLYKV